MKLSPLALLDWSHTTMGSDDLGKGSIKNCDRRAHLVRLRLPQPC
jgi:hypothetical protein